MSNSDWAIMWNQISNEEAEIADQVWMDLSEENQEILRNSQVIPESDADRFERPEKIDSESDAADAQICPYDHASSATELAFPLREDSELDDRLQALRVGTEGLRTRIPGSDQITYSPGREDSKVTEGNSLIDLNRETPQIDSDQEIEFDDKGPPRRFWRIPIPATAVQDDNPIQSIWTLSPERQEVIPKQPILLQIRGTSPEENIRPRTILPSRIVSIIPSEETIRSPGVVLSPNEEKFMRNLIQDCKDWTYAYYKGHPELNHWTCVLKLNRPVMGPEIPPPIYDDDHRPPRVQDIFPERIVVESIKEDSEEEEDDEEEIQEVNSVESHNLQSSEGQLRKPTKVVKVDVTATFSFCNDTVNARSDDLLALKAENQLELDLLGKAEVKPCLNEEFGPDFQVRKSDTHPNCFLVRPMNPEPPPDSSVLLDYKKRRKEMAEIEHFLERDFTHFGNFAPYLRRFKPGPERDEWLFEFFQKAYRNHDFRDDETLFNERCQQAAYYVTLHDQAIADSQGYKEHRDDYLRKG
jgi:hypothetical protein